MKISRILHSEVQDNCGKTWQNNAMNAAMVLLGNDELNSPYICRHDSVSSMTKIFEERIQKTALPCSLTEHHGKILTEDFIENLEAMNLYGLDSSLLEFGFSDPSLIESIVSSHPMITRDIEREEENLLKLSNSILKSIKRSSSPPKRRHDGTSPLPLGMDWSPPPRSWDAANTIWPHDFHTGWSYCVTVPSWSILADSGGSEPVVFYRVQVGLQSPEGATATHGVLKRFSDFLKLSSDLKQSFRNKKLPPAPSKGLLRFTNRKLLEERKCYLEDWMTKVLSDIDVSRSASVACFLELEAAARSFFRESSQDNVNLSCKSSSSLDPLSSQSDISLDPGTLAQTSNYSNASTCETSEIQSDLSVKDNCSESDKGNPISENDFASLTGATANEVSLENNSATLSKECGEGKGEKYAQKIFDERMNLDKIPSSTLSRQHDSVENRSGQEILAITSHTKGLSRESPKECTTSAAPRKIAISFDFHQDDNGPSSKCSGNIETSAATVSDLQFSPDTLVALPVDEQQKLRRLLTNMQQRLVTSKTDIEDLIRRLNQELAVRQYLTAKVNNLETELESTKQIGKENLEQTLSVERERFTQVQWDMQELRRKCMEMEFTLKADQDEKALALETKASTIKENEALRKELDSAREQLNNLQKCHEEADLKSKSEVKLLVKEVKSLRSSQSKMRQELESMSKERVEFEERVQKERMKRESINAANKKLLRECEILHSRLKECSVNFLVEQEHKLNMESPADAVDILATSENRIGLLLGEAQLLAQHIATPVASLNDESDNTMTTDDELRKMLTDIIIDNVVLRQQANSII